MIFRARVIGSVKRVPGMYDVSGYKPSAYMQPGIIASEKQVRFLIDTYLANDAKAKEGYDELMSNQPVNNTYDLPKKQLSIFVTPGASPLEISRLTNRLI